MAETNTKGISIGIWILIALAIYLYWAYNKCMTNPARPEGEKCDPFVGFDPIAKFFKDLFAPRPPIIPGKTEYEKCLEYNKTLAEGSDCNTCPSEGTQPVKKGKIQNGVCVPVPETQVPILVPITLPRTLKVINNVTGAQIYNYIPGTGTTPPYFNPTNNYVTFGVQLAYAQIITTQTGEIFYRTTVGWLSSEDVSVS